LSWLSRLELAGQWRHARRLLGTAGPIMGAARFYRWPERRSAGIAQTPAADDEMKSARSC